MENEATNNLATRLDIGLSRDDQARIDALRHVKVEKKSWTPGSIFAKLNDFATGLTKIKLQEKVSFFQLLAVMINAGMPIIRSLYVLADQNQNPKFAKIIRSLALEMEGGKSLSESMEEFPKVFGESEYGMVASGEATGNLNVILKNIALQAEKGSMILKKVKGAMIYPFAIILIMIAALFLMLTMIVPQITEIFTQGGKELPIATKILIESSDLAMNYWLPLLIGAGAVSAGFYFYAHTKLGRKQIHFGILFIPIFGKILKKVMVARFARMLALLLESGIPIVRSLEINANAIGNETYKERINYAGQDVTQGIPLGENLSNSDWLFPPMVSSMILVGEKTANITEVANKIADYYESEVDNAVSSLSKLMEPVILVAMGSVVGFLVAAIMQPIIALSDVSSVV